jgi:tetratricopeptide (TPR) repeat protein
MWASKEMSSLALNIGDYDAPRTYEARAWECFAGGKWDVALQESNNWLLDEPFAVKPAALGSYIAAAVLEDYERAEVILKAGLLANPHAPILRNNLAFALGSQSKTAEAEKYVSWTPQENLSLDNQINLLATKGLLLFREGDPDKGRSLYREAIDKAYRGSLPEHLGRALLYLAREEMLAKTQFSLTTLKEALDVTSKISDPDFQVLRERLRRFGSQRVTALP